MMRRATAQRLSRSGSSLDLVGKENEMVYPAHVIELKRLSPHASLNMKRSPAMTGPRTR